MGRLKAAKGGYYTSALAGFRLFCPFYGRKKNMRSVAAPGIQVFTRHIGQCGITLCFRRVPVKALPVVAEQAIESIVGRQTDAYSVRFGPGQIFRQIVFVA